MFQSTRLLLFLSLCVCTFCDDPDRQPVYKYRYETEDVMKTAASTIPFRGYQVVEGGFYPTGELGATGIGGVGSLGNYQVGVGHLGQGGGFIGPHGGQFIGNYAPVGLIGVGGLGGTGIVGHGLGGAGLIGPVAGGIGHAPLGYIGGTGGGAIGGAGIGIGQHGYGGETIEKGQFSEGHKKHNDEQYEKNEGRKGEEIKHGQEGFSKGEVAVKDVKGDSGYYQNVDGEKKVYEDGKQYHGGQHFNKEGKNEEEKAIKQGHKKGHKIKSFKTSHHKDETGKTEEYYDEAHDEGGNTAFKGESGSFGEKGASFFKGGNEEGKYKQEEAKKEGHYNSEHLLDKANANQGKYGENKFAGKQVVFGNKNGGEDQSLLGHQESSKFYKQHPFIIPFQH